MMHYSSWISQFLAYIGSCFGCCISHPITSVDKSSNGLKIQGVVVNKSGISEDFWSTSTYDLETSTYQSQRSFSSISVPNLGLTSAPGGPSSHSEFVNHGLILWNQSRAQWVGNKKSMNRPKHQEHPISYECLLGVTKKFPQPIPLTEIVDFLVDIWEQDGLYG